MDAQPWEPRCVFVCAYQRHCQYYIAHIVQFSAMVQFEPPIVQLAIIDYEPTCIFHNRTCAWEKWYAENTASLIARSVCQMTVFLPIVGTVMT